jgi:hypothetical protein
LAPGSFLATALGNTDLLDLLFFAEFFIVRAFETSIGGVAVGGTVEGGLVMQD